MNFSFKKTISQGIKEEKMGETTLIQKKEDVNAFLGKGSEFEGKLTFEGSVKIEGSFSGEIFSDGTLIVGEGAKIKAETNIGTLILYGEIVGNVKAKSSIEIHAPGRLRGNIQTSSLLVEKGAVFDGHCIMEGEGVKKVTEKAAPFVHLEEKALKV